MKCIAFKTYGMLGNKKYPDAYPALCHEVDSVEEGAEKYPEYLVMTGENFASYQEAMTTLYSDAVDKANKKKPWYKKILG